MEDGLERVPRGDIPNVSNGSDTPAVQVLDPSLPTCVDIDASYALDSKRNPQQ